jgi:endonuclease YncB( thermonuclease family)
MSRIQNILIVTVAVVSLLSARNTPAKEVTKLKNAKVVEIVDGDTIIAREAKYGIYFSSKRYILNLAGIQAFPVESDLGKEAYKYLKRQLKNEKINAYYIPSMNGWIVKRRSNDISEELVKRGLAYRVADDDMYIKAENSAKTRNKGLWKIPELAAKVRKMRDETLPLEQFEAHAVPDYFHDIQAPVEKSNYVEKREDFKVGHVYDVVITGIDYFYERATVPRTLYVYSSVTRNPKSLFFIIAGMDYRTVEELRPDEYLTVSCIFIKYVTVQSWYKTYEVPLFKFTGTTPTLGVGGELMYYE